MSQLARYPRGRSGELAPLPAGRTCASGRVDSAAAVVTLANDARPPPSRNAASHRLAAVTLAVLIGFASILSAVVAWQASLASIDASRLGSLGVQQRARVEQIERDLQGLIAQGPPLREPATRSMPSPRVSSDPRPRSCAATDCQRRRHPRPGGTGTRRSRPCRQALLPCRGRRNSQRRRH
jgi:hypothetical protein